jgi:hypothetical protein
VWIRRRHTNPDWDSNLESGFVLVMEEEEEVEEINEDDSRELVSKFEI